VVDPLLVHLFMDTPLYMLKEKAPLAIPEPVAAVQAEAVAVEVVEGEEARPEAKVRPISKPLPELPNGALFLIQRERGGEAVEFAALEMIHKIGAAMRFAPEQIWIEAADFAEYDISEAAMLSTGARVGILMGHTRPTHQELGITAYQTVRRVGQMALLATPRPEVLVPNRDDRTALWQALKAELGL
jgi:hypothetical protein